MVFRLKIGLKSAYLSVVVDGQPNHHNPPETHFPESQSSTANRWSYMKPSLRVKISIIVSSIQLPLTLIFFVNPDSTCTYNRPIILGHFINPSSTEEKVILII